MSDLQCPARFLVVAAPDGALAESLRHERVAAVYDGPPERGGTAALADALGLPLHVTSRRPVLRRLLDRVPDELEALGELADLHRGETVVVAGEGPPGQRVEVTVDGDGVAVAELSRGDAT